MRHLRLILGNVFRSALFRPATYGNKLPVARQAYGLPVFSRDSRRSQNAPTAYFFAHMIKPNRV
jgi:hypothetical protein